MVARNHIFLALEILSRASDSDLSQFVTQITAVVVRLQTLSSSNLRQPSAEKPSSRDPSTRASGSAESEASLDGEQNQPPTESNTVKEARRQAKGRARIEKLLTGAEARLDETRTFFRQKEAHAVGKPSWETEHPLIVDLHVKASETIESPQIQFRKALSRLELAIQFTRWEKEEAKYEFTTVQLYVENPHKSRSTGHIEQYLQAQSDINDKKQALHGIRHGIKLLVLQEHLKCNRRHSEEMHVCDVEGFSAILGFQFTDCRNIVFPDLQVLVNELRSERFHGIWQLVKESSGWFRKCQAIHAKNAEDALSAMHRKRKRVDDSAPHISNETYLMSLPQISPEGTSASRQAAAGSVTATDSPHESEHQANLLFEVLGQFQCSNKGTDDACADVEMLNPRNLRGQTTETLSEVHGRTPLPMEPMHETSSGNWLLDTQTVSGSEQEQQNLPSFIQDLPGYMRDDFLIDSQPGYMFEEDYFIQELPGYTRDDFFIHSQPGYMSGDKGGISFLPHNVQ